jgi:hypothetical protein
VIRYTATLHIVFLGIGYVWLLDNLTLINTLVVLFAQPIHYGLMAYHIYPFMCACLPWCSL